MDQKLEELIREIATKHGIVVGRDDPILVLQTINNRLLMDAASAQQALLASFKEELEAARHQWEQGARSAADRSAAAAATSILDAIRRGTDDSLATAQGTLRAELGRLDSRLLSRIREVRRLVMWNSITAAITLCAAALAVLASMGRL
jgi:hypothetical protein